MGAMTGGLIATGSCPSGGGGGGDWWNDFMACLGYAVKMFWRWVIERIAGKEEKKAA